MRLRLSLIGLLLCFPPHQIEGAKLNLGIVNFDSDQDRFHNGFSALFIASLVAAGYYTQDYWLVPLQDFMKRQGTPPTIIFNDNGGGGKKEDNSMSKFQNCRARIYQAGEVKTRFKDVAGCLGAKKDLEDIINFLKDPKAFNEMGAKIPKGVLLQGPPGTGKTLLAKALAGEVGVPFLSVCASEFIEAFVGIGAARIRDLFEKAKQLAPCIIFIDEFDAVGKKRSSSPGGGSDEYAQTLAQLLTLMDGFDPVKNPIIVIAATNRADVLDPAVLRPGRFDRKVEVGLPYVQDRIEILKVHLRNVKCSDNIDIPLIARATGGFSGAELAQLVNEAAILAVNRKSKIIEMKDIDLAYDHVTIGRETMGMDRNQVELMKTAIHESGHAIGMIYQPLFMDPLYKVTITPRGGALGLTWSIPLKESYGHSDDEFKAQIVMILAGGLAEEAFGYGQWSGKSSDIKKAYRIAYNMVVRYGMSDDLCYISYDDIDHVLPNDIATRVHDATKKIVDECYEKSQALVNDHKNEIQQLADLLMQKGTVSGYDVYRMFGLPIPNIDFSLS